MSDQTVPEDFAYRLRTARRHAGLGVEKLSAKMGLQRGASASTLKLYEKDKHLDSLIADRFIERLAESTSIPVAYFWGDDSAFPASRQEVASSLDPESGSGAFLIAAIKGLQEHVSGLEQQQSELHDQMAEIIGLLTGKPEARASLGDTIARVVEDAMTQRAEKVGLRGRRRPPPRQDEGQRPAA
jgi:transcriptional regulator with XRE-family HTH domain